MKRDYAERMQMRGESKNVMFYVHGGTYFFGDWTWAAGPEACEELNRLIIPLFWRY
jgi:hypothetical protein